VSECAAKDNEVKDDDQHTSRHDELARVALMKQPVPIADRTAFLSLLFGTGAELMELRSLPSKAQTFARPDQLDDTAAAFVAAHSQEDVYVGVASRRDASSGRLENCSWLSVLFADIDFKMSSEAAAREQVARFKISPTIVVGSGGGLHAYWWLAEPIDAQATLTKARLRRLAHAVGGDLAAAEPARILRLPDTLNHKYEPARLVQIEMFEPARRYSVSEFDRLLPAQPTAPAADASADAGHIGEGQRNVKLFAIARSLRAHRLTPEVIAFMVQTANTYLCRPPLDASEVKSIIASAITQPDRAEFASRRRLVRLASRKTVTVTLA
jgi:primase-like protein/DNA primase RepB-like protein